MTQNANIPELWKSLAISAGFPLMAYLLYDKRGRYEKMHKEIFGIEPLRYIPLHRRPAAWVWRELLFGWVDLWVAEVQGYVYFSFHPEKYERWEKLAKAYYGEPKPPLTVKEMKKRVKDAPKTVKKFVKDVQRRLRVSWAILRTGTIPRTLL